MTDKGISGVVVAILLTIVGIAAVLAFYTIIWPLISPPMGFEIASVKLWVVSGKTVIEVELKNTGSVDLNIDEVQVYAGGSWQTASITTADKYLPAGQSRSITAELGQALTPGESYLVKVICSNPSRGTTDKTASATATRV